MCKLGLWPSNSFSGNICFEFSTFALWCSLFLVALLSTSCAASNRQFHSCSRYGVKFFKDVVMNNKTSLSGMMEDIYS